MATIRNVDYTKVPGIASRIRSGGNEVNREMTSVYSSLDGMRNVWYGQRYNELVKKSNNMISSINEMLEFLVTKVPSDLETVANNYSQADKGENVCAISDESPNKITEVAASTEVGMRFLSGDVADIQSSVSSSFSKVLDLLNTSIESAFKEIDWESEAATAYKNAFATLKTNIGNSVDEIKKEFADQINNAANDIEKAESSNTVQ